MNITLWETVRSWLQYESVIPRERQCHSSQ